ncbi:MULTISPECIES: ABC transporter permease [Kocuria]|uniref:Dipeptide transport system permease protein DppB n=1 Tax=Kocuria palustris PEL TaxID=1236550 RepID=M2XXJ3_9MICC|nr:MULTISPECIES: ABC transporter permease [Kocuria]MDN5702271.1 ABC transporter permease [Micrococcales bacterium]EME37533.1 Dipeptide transport system permease protein DppB [Kocuria palustris PEL]KUG52691.1 peptide ABC transporter permease [Kocuria palustris]MCT1590833.1 ABC transporter permease [Kocuria palustris]MDH5152571.1 ABC transporter permease [Kocuria palustris]
MLSMILKRLAVSVLVLLAVSFVVFVFTLLLPGDPAQAILGQQATPERLEALRSQLGLDQPWWQRYFDWLGGILTGDLGVSAATGGSISALLGERIVNSLVLMAIAAVIAVPLGLALGTWAALRRGRASDTALNTGSMILASLPEFVVGIVLVALFSTTVLQILPSVTMAAPGTRVWEFPLQLVLPVAALVLVVVPYMVRMMRQTMTEVLSSGYVEMARLKGVPERQVILRHALPHAIGPVAQVVAMQLAWLAGGIVVIEVLFRYPGIGQAMVDAVNNRDVQVVQTISLLIAAFYVVVNLLADVVGILANPKLRTESGR